MGPVRLSVGVEFLLDGRAYRVVRQLANDRFVSQDAKFHVEEEFSETQLLSFYAQGRLRFATDPDSDHEPMKTIGSKKGPPFFRLWEMSRLSKKRIGNS